LFSDLNNTKIITKCLENMNYLESLTINSNNLGVNECEILFNSQNMLKNLIILDLGNNNIDDECLFIICSCNFERIKKFIMNKNKISNL
jgi:hypothetical protein